MLSYSKKWSFATTITRATAHQVPQQVKAEAAALLHQLYAAHKESLHQALDQIKPALYASPWLMNSLTSNPKLFEDYLQSENWQLPGSCSSRLQSMLEERAAELDEAKFKQLLRNFRRREMAAIAIRDLMGYESLDKSLKNISELAKQSLRVALRFAEQAMRPRYGFAQNKQGEKQNMLVIGMGKLGGNELNFSSDIDLIFFYPESGMTSGARCVDNAQYFTKLGQMLIRLLDEQTVDGFVFRVDMRLRPFGDAGALAINFDAAENYYLSQGREWERYAMIKALAITGKANDINNLQAILFPFVYRRYLDFSAIQSLRDLKTMIDAQVHKNNVEDNIKLGRGGIREVEFIGQALQLVYGGGNATLRTQSIVEVLQLLAEQKMLKKKQIDELLDAYAFLRFAENRLQMSGDKQVHSLPTTTIERQRLAYAMGFDNWQDFKTELKLHQSRVTKHFGNVFETKYDKDKSRQWQKLWLALDAKQKLNSQQLTEKYPAAISLLQKNDYANPGQALLRLLTFKRSFNYARGSKQSRDRVNTLMPQLLRTLAKLKTDKSELLQRVLQLLPVISRRFAYLVLLEENPKALKRLLQLMGQSKWLGEQIIRTPLLLDQLVDVRELYAIAERPELDQIISRQLNALVKAELEEKMNELRRLKSSYVFRVACVDLNENIPLMRVSDHLTQCAEVMVENAHQMAWQETCSRYGVPTGSDAGKLICPTMAVIAYGKLGGIELGYGSDLDLVFLHNSEGDNTVTKIEQTQQKSIDNTLFFARLAQKLYSILNAQTALGQLYEVDLRLRPDGHAGEWVKSMSGFASYQQQKAWAWEHQALVRARFISGDSSLKKMFEKIRHRVLCMVRDKVKLRQEVLVMREKMRQTLATNKHGYCLKYNRGGLADIEFLVQYLVLAWSNELPELTKWTDNIRILEHLAELGLLKQQQSRALIESYRRIRAIIHRLDLDKKQAVLEDFSSLQPYIDNVATIWQQVMVANVLSYNNKT